MANNSSTIVQRVVGIILGMEEGFLESFRAAGESIERIKTYGLYLVSEPSQG